MEGTCTLLILSISSSSLLAICSLHDLIFDGKGISKGEERWINRTLEILGGEFTT